MTLCLERYHLWYFAFSRAEKGIHWSLLTFDLQRKLDDPRYFFVLFRSFVKISTLTWILYPFSQSRIPFPWMLMLWIFSSMDPSKSLRKKTGKRVTKFFYSMCWKKKYLINKHQSSPIWTVLFLLVNLIFKFPHVKLLDYKKVVNFVKGTLLLLGSFFISRSIWILKTLLLSLTMCTDFTECKLAMSSMLSRSFTWLSSQSGNSC